MKRDYLKNLDIGGGAHLSDDLIERIMSEDGKAKAEMQNTITTLTTERDGLKTQLSDANAAIQSYKDMDIEGIKQSAADWETKYNTDTQALKDQLKGVQYAHAGEGQVRIPLRATHHIFQSTLPMRGGTHCAYSQIIRGSFQSTLPVRGGTSQGTAGSVRSPQFQSTLPVRGGTTERRTAPALQ